MPLRKIGELKVPSDQAYLTEVDRFVDKLLKRIRLPSGDLDDIAIAVSEAVNNAMVHGNKLDVKKSVEIRFYVCSILIMHHLMDRIVFNRRKTGMQVVMDKHCPEGCYRER